MYKVIWLLKRKDGITLQQFRDHYENSHSVLGKKYLGHLLLEYTRNYNAGTMGGDVPTAASGGGGGSFGPVPFGYDCIVEWVMPSEQAFEEIMSLFADPEIGRIFYEDEEHFLDRKATLLFKCDVSDTGTGDGHGTLSRVAQEG